MNPNLPVSDEIAVLGAIDPDAYAANTYTTPWIDAALFHQFQAVVMVGTAAATTTVNAKIEQDIAGDNAETKDVTGKAITEIGTAGSDGQALIDLAQDDLDVENGFRYFRLSVTTANDTCDLSGLVLGKDPVHYPASDHDADSVAEIVD